MEFHDFAKAFNRNRYVYLNSILSDPPLTGLYRYACKRAEAGTLNAGDEQLPSTPCASSDPLMDTLLSSLLPKIEKYSSLDLYPTYSYFRVYKKGDVLQRHRDRAACEVSVTLCLGGDSSWPFWLESHSSDVKLEMAPGDAVLYRGIECPHWREPFEGNRLVQVFLHYVDKRGPYADWKFHGRRTTGLPIGRAH